MILPGCFFVLGINLSQSVEIMQLSTNIDIGCNEWVWTYDRSFGYFITPY